MQLNLIKIGKTLVLGTAFAALLPLWAHAKTGAQKTPETVSTQAVAMASTEDHAGALAYIAAQDENIRESYEVRFTKARILSWSGDHGDAAREYEALLRDYPGNPDILNGYGYLEYYRENLDAAEGHFNQVLLDYPGYKDSSDGLNRVKRARLDRLGTDYRWRIDLSGGISSFNNDLDNWNEQSIRAEYVPGEIGFFGSATRYERFGYDDIQFMAGARSNTDKDWDWEVGLGVTPDADFRAELTGMARAGYKLDFVNDSVVHASLGYQIDDYALVGQVHQISPQLVTYLDNGAVVTTRLVHVRQDGEDAQTGFLTSGLYPLTTRLDVRAGYAQAPEAVNGIVVDTESLFGGFSYRLSEHIQLHGTFARDDRKGVYIKDGFNVGLTQKY